jgi:tetratricopeptide (TPR) repeat protein
VNKLLIYTLICILNVTTFFSQSGKVDSLLLCLKKAKIDTIKTEILNQLFVETVGSDPDKAMEYCNQSLAIASKIKNKRIIATVLNSICVAYDYKGDYKNSVDYALKSLKIKEEISDTLGISLSFRTLGNICLYQNKFAEAKEYFLKELALEPRLKNKAALGGCYNNLGVANERLKLYDEAYKYYMLSLKISESLNDKRLMAQTLNNIGNIFYFQKNYEKCLIYYFKALKINEELGEKYQVTGISTNIGTVYADKMDLKNAIKMFESSLVISKEIKALDLEIENYVALANAYKEMKKYKEAFGYYDLYTKSKDTLLNIESDKQIAEMQTKYETEKKDKAIQLLHKDQALNVAEIEKQKAEADKKNAQRNVFIVGFSLVLILAGFIFNGLKQQRKANRIIQEQKEQVERSKEVIEIQKELVEEKQKEILDSIKYARRIQQSLLPTEKYIERKLKNKS